jgi:transcription initiation factor TFIIIB Brf1 subunit/transcription initiation factor TFIIB
MFKPCENCGSKDDFILNEQSDYVCTKCGIVERRYNYMENVCHKRKKKNEDCSTTEYCVTDREKEKEINYVTKRVNSLVCPEEVRDNRFEKLVNDCGELLDSNTRIREKVVLFFNKYPEIKKFKPRLATVGAIFILASQSLGVYLSPKHTCTMLGVDNVNERLKQVCSEVNINYMSVILNAVPYLCDQLGLQFKFRKRLEAEYKKISRSNPSMGPDTRMALCCYYLVNQVGNPHNLTVVDIAQLTNTSECSLNNYINGKVKCSLTFEKPKRKRQGETIVNNPKRKKSTNL